MGSGTCAALLMLATDPGRDRAYPPVGLTATGCLVAPAPTPWLIIAFDMELPRDFGRGRYAFEVAWALLDCRAGRMSCLRGEAGGALISPATEAGLLGGGSCGSNVEAEPGRGRGVPAVEERASPVLGGSEGGARDASEKCVYGAARCCVLDAEEVRMGGEAM